MLVHRSPDGTLTQSYRRPDGSWYSIAGHPDGSYTESDADRPPGTGLALLTRPVVPAEGREDSAD